MRKSKTVYQLEAFPRIYSEIQKTAFHGYAKIRNKRLRNLNCFERLIVEYPLISILVCLILGSVITLCIALIIKTSGVNPDWVDLCLSTGAILTQVSIFIVWLRIARFKGSPTGEYRFYLEAELLKERYEKEKYQLSSLRFALDSYIKNKDFGFKLFAGAAAALLLYLKIDSVGFGKSDKMLGSAMQWLAPIGQTWNGQLVFGLMYLSIFFFILTFFYMPKIWAEQVKSSLDLICEQEKSKTSGSDA